MSAPSDSATFVAEILNAAWLVRHYRHGPARDQAIQRLGLTVREAFNTSDEYERLLEALLNGLSTKDDRRL
jgi:hypothetical protein